MKMITLGAPGSDQFGALPAGGGGMEFVGGLDSWSPDALAPHVQGYMAALTESIASEARRFAAEAETYKESWASLLDGNTKLAEYTGAAIGPGDPLYASGTLDAPTNVTTGLLITKTTSDTPFGHLDPTGPSISSGSTNTAANVQI